MKLPVEGKRAAVVETTGADAHTLAKIALADAATELDTLLGEVGAEREMDETIGADSGLNECRWQRLATLVSTTWPVMKDSQAEMKLQLG